MQKKYTTHFCSNHLTSGTLGDSFLECLPRKAWSRACGLGRTTKSFDRRPFLLLGPPPPLQWTSREKNRIPPSAGMHHREASLSPVGSSGLQDGLSYRRLLSCLLVTSLERPRLCIYGILCGLIRVLRNSTGCVCENMLARTYCRQLRGPRGCCFSEAP